jgi:hypothetical protein
MTSDADQFPLNLRFAGAVFFSIYSLLLMLFTKYTLLTLRETALLPLLPSIFIALITGAFTGYCFGKMLAKKGKWYRSFFIGLLLACLFLILGSIAVLIHSYFTDSTFLNRSQQWQDYFVIYGAILAMLTVTIGSWLIPLTGLIAVYFNKQFLPGLIAADTERLKTDNSTKTDRSHDNKQ